MRLRRELTLASACGLALAFAGCGIEDPYENAETREDRKATGRSGPAQSALASGREDGARVAVLERFALEWTNWAFRDLARNRRALAELAAGELRTALLGEAQQAANEAVLRSSNLENRGSVAGILTRGARPTLVITRETVEAEDGSAQSGYDVYLVRAERTPDGWKVTEWKPTS